ncbi:MAG: neuraminidase-like domain-containing protein [Candidatus Methanoperedens sp.]|nr:neuraminidase-like domain-containing protein [Candidatus Methanoperedens sp.]
MNELLADLVGYILGYLFIWNKVEDTENNPGNEKYKLINYLKQKFGLEWLDPVQVIIREIDDYTIKVKGSFQWPPFSQNYILIKLNNRKTNAHLIISNDTRTDDFIVKTESGKLIVYPGGSQSSTYMPRSTTGTSEERRAWAEHEPPETVLAELATVARPWTLPYNYEQDRADHAREVLPVEENAVIEAVWGFETLAAAQGQDSSNMYPRSLAWHVLHLTKAEIDLLSAIAANSWKSRTVEALERTWGNEVVSALISKKSPTVAALERAGSFDFPALEDALETRFVRTALGSAFLFSWDKIPGIHNGRLIEFLKQKFGIDWVKTAKIEKNENGMTIKVSTEKNYLSLKIKDNQTVVFVQTDNGRACTLKVLRENGEPNIYKDLFKPFNTCDPEKLLLEAPFEEMPAILNRLYYFERVRRKIDWTANQLDNALSEMEQEKTVNKDNLLNIGLLHYLQQRLQVGPDAVLCLFRNPSSLRPFTLRQEKSVLSPFERLFGIEPVNLPALTGDDAADANAADVVVANIATRVGVGSDEVRFVLSKGYAGIGVKPFTDPLDILRASDPLDAWRAAVAGVFRIATFAEALGLSITDFIALVELSNANPLLRPGVECNMFQQLINAVSFVNLAHDTSNWPLSVSEVLYLTTTDDFASRMYAPDAIKAGNLFKKLQAEVSRVAESFEIAGAAVTKVQQVLSELLGEASPQRFDGQSVPEKAIDRIQRMIEWSSVFPGFKAQVIASLPASAVLENEVLDPDKAELAEAALTWLDVLDITNRVSVLPELFRRHLAQVIGTTGIDETGNEYQNVLMALRDETEAMVRDPGLAGVGHLSNVIKPLLTLMGIPDNELEAKAKTLASAVLYAAAQTVSSRMEPFRIRATQRWLPALTAAVQRGKIDTIVIELLATAFSLDAAEARRHLTQLLRDPAHDQALLRAFVSRDGSTEQVDASLVQASYVNLEEPSGSSSVGGAATATTAPSKVHLAVNRIEPSLQLDWAASPPPAGINTERFQVTLSASVATAALKTASGIRRLVVESTGHVTMSLLAGTHESQVLELIASDRLQRQEWDKAKVAAFFAASTPDSDTEVRIVFTFATVPGAALEAAATAKAPQVLRVLVEAEDKELVPLSTGMLAQALIHLDKAARLVRVLSLPPTTWSMLASLPGDRRIDLNDLRITVWQKVVSIRQILKRHNDEADVSALHSIVTASPVSIDVLARALGLTRTELQDLLKLLEISPEPDGKTVSVTSDWRTLDAALRLSDLARGACLPLAAITGWITAPARNSYQWALGALRALRPREEWLKVLQYIHDPVREHLRDALVAWLVTHHRYGSEPFKDAESISAHLLTDVQMSSCLASSRVQFGYAAVQRYIDAIRLGFEQGPEDAESQERFEREWNWRRFYRLWEANRRVFTYPENWLEPDMRPDKTPFFQELEDQLMEGPLTTLSAENALANYLGKLVDVARPEIVGIIHESELPDEHSPIGFRDPDLQGTHVFGRSRSQPHQLYYRRRLPFPDHRWTPWERIDAELPGTHFVPVIAFQRLYLICAEFGLGKKIPDPCDQQIDATSLTKSKILRKNANVILSWVERRHGMWSALHRSEPIEIDMSHIKYDDPLDNDGWPDFPVNSFPDVEIKGENIKYINVSVKTDRDGIDANGYSKLSVVLKLKSGKEILNDDLYKGYPDETRGVLPYTVISKQFNLNEEVKPSEIKSLVIKYKGHPHNGGTYYGDHCILNKIEYSLLTTSGSHYHSQSLEGYLEFPWMGKDYDWSLDVPPEASSWVRCYDPGIREYFEPSSEGWVSPPSEAYAIHAVPPNTFNGGPLKLNLFINDGLMVRMPYSRNFTFKGFLDEKRKNAVKGIWKDNTQVAGLQRCILRTVYGDWLQTIELFSDDTVHTPSNYSSIDSKPRRGKYHDNSTIAWKQIFRSVEKSPTSSRLFITGNTDALVLTRPYHVLVENKGLITNATAPKILDEISEVNDGRTFYIELVTAASVTLNTNADQKGSVWAFHVFWHPQAVGFLRLLQAYGVPQLLTFQAQKLTHPALGNESCQKNFFENYHPTLGVFSQYPVADVDFTPKGAYSDYNWEIFFHAPLLIASRLSEAGQFDEADRWFKLLFDPARGRLNANPLESFQTRPLREAITQRLEDMLHLLNDQEVKADFKEQVDRLNRYPYHPHLIARSRLSAYQKTLVMKYLDHLIAWGDELFRRAYATDNRTELENAGSRYDLVARLLGKRPEVLPTGFQDSTMSFDGLWKNKDELYLWDPLVKIEDHMLDTWDPLVKIEDHMLDTWDPLTLKVLVHLQDIGDLTFHENEFAGTKGEGRRLEGFQIDFNPPIPNLGMRYMAHLQDLGNVPYVNAGQFIGTRREGRRLEGFSIELTGLEADNYEVIYMAHLQGSGDTELCRAGQFCGTRGKGISVEGIMVRIIKKKTPQFSSVISGTDGRPAVPNDGEGIPEYLYFCVPHNDELLKYWDTLADRLTKMRTCRDIEGVRRTLSLYGRRIDPGLLVRATAMGLDIDVLLGYLSAPLPRFRFNVLLQRARGACDRAQAFGQALLSAIEKREAEELAKLRSAHEVTLLRAAKRVRDEQVSEAEESLESLRKSRESAEARHRFYSTRERVSPQETAESKALEEASKKEQLAAGASASAADLAFIPGFPVSLNATASAWQGSSTGYEARLSASGGNSYDFGGEFLSKIAERQALGHRHTAERSRTEAARIGREAQHDRRWDDWQLQKELAEKDMEQIDRQIASAEIRVRIAGIEQENQMQQIDQAATIDAYLRDKFTNARLYRWMESRMSRLYYQQYRLAYDLALKAQHALRYELGLEEESLLPDTWDPSHRGLEAASDLQHELEKLETRYVDSWRREHEKQKTFSLADRRPLDFLELRQRGTCVIRILEHELDEDEPGDYFRRIKQVSVSIPCVVGPDVSVNARLTLLRSEVRIKQYLTGKYARDEGPDGASDESFRDYSGGADHIVTSTGVNDTGQFDTGLGGDRLLPFEGAGVISTWQIDLPVETNHFDRASLADVKLRILYTARDGGDAARKAALEERKKYLKNAGREVLLPLASSFSSAWIGFTAENTTPRDRELKLEIRAEHLPFALRSFRLAGVDLYFEADDKPTLTDGTGLQLDLNGLYRFTPKGPVELGTPFGLTLKSNSAVPRKGWAVLLMKMTS